MFLLLLNNNNGNFLGTGEPEPGSGEPEPGAGDNYKYPESLDKEYHGNPTLLKYVNKETGEFDSANIMKALIHSSKAIGADKMLVPNNEFTDEQWKDHFKKSGLPELDKYEVANNVAEGVQTNEDMLKGFKAAAHEAGILPKQAQAVLD